MRRVRVTIFAVEKAVSIKYPECVSTCFFIQHAVRVARLMLPYVACLAGPYLSALSHKGNDF